MERYLTNWGEQKPRQGLALDFDYFAVSRRRDLGPEMKEAANEAASHSPPP